MIEYENLNWKNLEIIKKHVFPRLMKPLQQAMDSIAYAQNIEESGGNMAETLAEAYRHLDITMTVNKAWDLLIQWKIEGKITDGEMQNIAPSQMPDWFLDFLGQKAIVKLEHTDTIRVYPHAFYEGVILLVNIAETVGELSHIMFNDAAEPREGVWIRIVFKPPKDKPYRSKVAIIDQLDKKDPITKDVALQFVVASDLFGLNDTRFSLQNNTRTGHQAFAVLLPVTPRSEDEASTSVDTQELDQAETEIEITTSEVAQNAAEVEAETTAEVSSPSGDEFSTSELEAPKPPESAQTVEDKASVDKTANSNGTEKHVDGESAHALVDSKALETLAQIYKILEAEAKTRNLSGAALSTGSKSSNQLKAEDVLDRVYAVLREEYVKSTIPTDEIAEKATGILSTIRNILDSYHEVVQGIRTSGDKGNEIEKSKPSMTKDVLITIHTLLEDNPSPNGTAEEYDTTRSEDKKDKLSSQEVEQVTLSQDAKDTSEMAAVQAEPEEANEDAASSSTSPNNKSAPENPRLTPLS